MFALEVTLLTGRYVATSFDDRGRAEWPPHPARLFSALAATYFEAGERASAEREALRWLELLGPPHIAASAAAEREVVTVFVPVNDVSVVPLLDDESGAVEEAGRALAAAHAGGGKEGAALERKLAKAKERFAAAMSKATAAVPSGKEGKDGPARAAAVLPERRIRQPRTFPSVTPTDPRVVFAWPDAEPSPEMRAAVDGLAARVVRIGHSSSLVSIAVRSDAPPATWQPDTSGEVRSPKDELVLRVVDAGQLSALESTPTDQLDEPGRVMPSSFQRYVRQLGQAEQRAPTTMFSQDWIVLKRIGGPRLPSTRVADVARTVRKALMRAYGEGAPEILTGHRAQGIASDAPHLAIVPLPFVAHERADGSILGVALIVPASASEEDRRAVVRAVHNWRSQHPGRDGEPSGLPVHLGRAGELLLALPDDGPEQATLMPRTWCGRSQAWATATPIALDRNPGDLRSTDPRREAEAYAAAEETIALACQRVGLPRPASVAAMPAAPLAGADKVKAFAPFESGAQALRRVLIHARLEFDQPVEGPILLGAGRYFGLGLMRPVARHG